MRAIGVFINKKGLIFESTINDVLTEITRNMKKMVVLP